MRIGIIAEGHADRAVIENILIGLTGLDISDFVALRPADLQDETDRARQNPAGFGSWTHVKKECESRELIDPFLILDDHEFIVLQIDSAETHLYGVERPSNSTDNFYLELRNLIKDCINHWLQQDLSSQLLYAIAIEEIDAWVLTLYEEGNTGRYLNVKKQLKRVLSKKGIDSTSNYHNYQSLTKDLSKARSFKNGKYTDRNRSLAAFCQEVKEKLIPKLPIIS